MCVFIRIVIVIAARCVVTLNDYIHLSNLLDHKIVHGDRSGILV